MKLAIIFLALCASVRAQTLINGSRVHAGTTNAATSTGSANAYVLTLSPVLPAYGTNHCYRFNANFANTATATVNINALGAKTLVKVAGGITTALAANDIRSGQIVDVCYDGTNMQVMSTLGNAAAGSGGGYMFTGGCTGLVTNGATTALGGLGVATSGSCSSSTNLSSANLGVIVTRNCTLGKLYVATGNGAGTGAGDGVVTIRTGSPNAAVSTTGITCTIGTGTTCNDTTNTSAATAGQMVYMVVVGAATTTMGYMSGSVECNP